MLLGGCGDLYIWVTPQRFLDVLRRLGGLGLQKLADVPPGNAHVNGPFVLERISPDGTVTNFTAPEVRRNSYDLAAGSDGSVYFATDNNTAIGAIMKVPPGQGEVLLAGRAGAGAVDGQGAQARFGFVLSGLSLVRPALTMTVDGVGNVFLSENGSIRRILKDGVVTTLTGRPACSRVSEWPTLPTGRSMRPLWR